MDGLQWKTLLKWMIWGYPYFWKHPYICPMDPSWVLILRKSGAVELVFRPRKSSRRPNELPRLVGSGSYMDHPKDSVWLTGLPGDIYIYIIYIYNIHEPIHLGNKQGVLHLTLTIS